MNTKSTKKGVIPKKERWLFEPQNRVILKKLKKALRQAADRTIDLGSFDT